MEVFLRDLKNLSLADKDGRTPLHTACTYGHLNIAEMLLKHGAKIDPVNKWCSTPLHIACTYGHLNVAEMLVANGANIHQEDNFARKPLHLAYRKQNQKNIVAMLLTAGLAVPPGDLRRIQELFPEIALTPDPKNGGHFILAAASDPMVHVNAVNQKFTESLPALLGDAITHESVLPQLIASLYKAEFIKEIQKNFGEGTKVPVLPWQQQVFEDEALALAGNFMTIKTFTPTIPEGEKSSTEPIEATATSTEKKQPKSYVELVKEKEQSVSLFPQPQGRVHSLQKFAAQSFANALVDDKADVPPKPETFALAEELRRAQGEEKESARIL